MIDSGDLGKALLIRVDRRLGNRLDVAGAVVIRAPNQDFGALPVHLEGFRQVGLVETVQPHQDAVEGGWRRAEALYLPRHEPHACFGRQPGRLGIQPHIAYAAGTGQGREQAV